MTERKAFATEMKKLVFSNHATKVANHFKAV